MGSREAAREDATMVATVRDVAAMVAETYGIDSDEAMRAVRQVPGRYEDMVERVDDGEERLTAATRAIVEREIGWQG